jgi:hypothetical protein
MAAIEETPDQLGMRRADMSDSSWFYDGSFDGTAGATLACTVCEK